MPMGAEVLVNLVDKKAVADAIGKNREKLFASLKAAWRNPSAE